MSKKKITIKPKNYSQHIEDKLDQWVNSDVKESTIDTQLDNEFSESRFTIVIPQLLHRRIKKYCAIKGLSMKTYLTEILEKEIKEF